MGKLYKLINEAKNAAQIVSRQNAVLHVRVTPLPADLRAKISDSLKHGKAAAGDQKAK